MDKLKKVFSPGHQKDEEVLYDDNNNNNNNTTTTGNTHGEDSHLNQTQPTATPTIGTGKHDTDLRQHVLDPHSDKTSRPAPGVSSHLSSGSGIADDASTASIRSGVVGSAEQLSTPAMGSAGYGSASSATQQTLPDRTAERSFPLTSGNNTSNPTTRDTNPLTQHQHEGRGHQFGGDPCPPSAEAPVPGYVHHIPGPHGTDMANRLDPHVPGEFPTGDGSERHHHGTSVPAAGVGAASLDAHESGRNLGQAPATSTLREEPREGHHYGQNAALAAGAGTIGAGAYEANKHHNERSGPETLRDTTSTSGVPSSTTTSASGAPYSTTTSTSAIPSSTTTNTTAVPASTAPSSTRDMTSDPSREHHLGRDAALVGGAGAAGLGAHELGSHKHDHDVPFQGTGRYDDQSFDPNAAHSERSKHIPDLMYGSSATHSGQAPVSQSHGRDAALDAGAAGVGATGSGHRAGPTETDPASKTIGPHKSNLANIFDPRVQPEPSKMKGAVNDGPYRREEPQHQYGRDAAMVGGAGAVGAAAYEAGHRGGPTATDPASNTIGPHSSNAANILDPRVQPEPERMKDRTTAGPHNSDALNRADPRVDSDLSNQQNPQHHYGRDAALAGGAGAAGVGAYEYGKNNTGASSQVPTSSTNDPMGSTTAPFGSTTAPHQSGMLNSADPRVDSTSTQQGQQHHYGRDAALAGGAGAAGVGAYEYGKHDTTGASQQLPTSSNTAPTSSTTTPHQSGALNRADPRVDSDITQQNKEHHYGRDAALVGGTGAAAYGAHEAIDAKQEEKLEKERLKEAEKAHKAEQKEHDKELKHEKKEHDKEVKHEQKEHDKEVKHQEHEREKELKHQQHEREKQIEKDQKLALKEQEKEEKKAAALAAAAREKSEKQHRHDAEKAEKEREKAEKEHEKENEKGEKKHGLFGFLKGKEKTKGSDEEETLREQGNPQEADRLSHERHQRELETGATHGDLHAAGAGYEPPLEQQREQPLASAPQYVSIDDNGHQHVSTDPQGRHRLHKDPPASVLRERGLEPTEHS